MPRYPVDQRIKVAGQIPFGQPDPNAKHGYHAGDDSANGTGTPVYAAASGTVTSSIGGTAPTNYQGISVEIFDGTYYPHVFHLKQRLVSPGDRVSEGQLIGYSDNTGLSTGPHVHFGVGRVPYPTSKSINDYIDPMEYIKKGDDMSTVGEVEFNYLFFNFFGDKVQPTEGDRKRWIGAETNTVIRQMQADPRQPDYDKYVKDLEKAAQSGGPAPTPPVAIKLEKGLYEV